MLAPILPTNCQNLNATILELLMDNSLQQLCSFMENIKNQVEIKRAVGNMEVSVANRILRVVVESDQGWMWVQAVLREHEGKIEEELVEIVKQKVTQTQPIDINSYHKLEGKMQLLIYGNSA